MVANVIKTKIKLILNLSITFKKDKFQTFVREDSQNCHLNFCLQHLFISTCVMI